MPRESPAAPQALLTTANVWKAVQRIEAAANPSLAVNDGTTDVFTVDQWGHIYSAVTPANIPTVAVQAAAGTGATAALLAGSTDSAGVILLDTGTTPGGGAQVILTFGKSYGNPPVIVFSPQAPTGYAGAFNTASIISVTATAFTFNSNAALTASYHYGIAYNVMGQ